MSWVNGLAARLRLVFARRSSEARFDRELLFHVDMEADRLVREEGLEPDEARRRALAAFGGVQQYREALREGAGTVWIAGWSLDLKLGYRMLLRFPGLTLVGILGISVAVTIGVVAFTAVETVTSTSLPFAGGDRVVAIQNIDVRDNDEGRRTHLHDLEVWRESLAGVEELGAYRTVERNLVTTAFPPVSVRVAEMSASGFRVARAVPSRGRSLLDDDEHPDAPPVAVIGYDVWQEQLGGRPDIVGSTLFLGRTAFTVVGVMPSGFGFPVNNQVWVPLRLNPLAWERGNAPAINVFGRLAAGVSLADAELQLRTIGERLSMAYPATHEYIRPRIVRYSRAFLDSPGMAWQLHLVQVIVSLLLVVIGTNVAALVYARTAGREAELTVRTALGAGRRRIVAQLFAEALVLSAVAALVGVVVARGIFQRLETLLRNTADDQIPYWMHLELSPAVVAYTAGLAMLAAVIIGVVPGLKATRRGLSQSLRQLSGGTAMQLGRGWTVLLVAQVAVSVAALPAALVGGKQFLELARLEHGNTTTASVVMATPMAEAADGVPGANEVDERDRYVTTVRELARRLREAPGRIDVVLMSSDPGAESGEWFDDAGSRSAGFVQFDDRSTATRVDTLATAGTYATFNQVDSAFFGQFEVRVLAGRTFVPTDFAPGAPAAIVNQSFVKRYLAGGPALGLRFRPVPSRSRAAEAIDETRIPDWDIVGVVADFPPPASAEALRPRVYLPLRAATVYPLKLAVRSGTLGTAAVIERVRTIGQGVDPTLHFRSIRVLDDILADGLRAQRLALLGLVAVALSVVFLSSASIYALMSFTVTRRRREIGIRCALGARRARVLADVLARAMRQIGLGIGIGMLGIWAVAGLSRGSAAWAEVIVQVAVLGLLMVAVGVLASVGPARRALCVQPTEALKAE